MSDSSALLADAVRRLAAAGVGSPRLDARVLLEHARSLSSPVHGGGAERSEADGASLFESFVIRRAEREPLAYITGRREFWSLDFEVTPGTLIPRPETETIIEQALALLTDHSAPLDVLDLGTGTGCLLIAFLKEFPSARGLGIDFSEKACAVARRNMARHGVEKRCEIRHGDWAGTVTGTFDVILSNPPYVRTADLKDLEPEVARYEPIMALDGGPDGLAAYRLLAPQLARLLRPGGHALVEIGAGQSDEVAALMVQAGLETVRIAPDLAGIPRVLVVRRLA